MNRLLDLICGNKFFNNDNMPPEARAAMQRMCNNLNSPIKPAMSDEQFEALPYLEKCMLTCNTPKCGKVVSSHGSLCVEHKGESNAKFKTK